MMTVARKIPAPTRDRLARRTRVMHIVPAMSVGGIPSVVATLFDTTDPERFELSLLCLNSVGTVGEDLRCRGFPVFEVEPRAGGKPNYLAFLDVARILRRERVDVVHTHNTQAFVDGALGAKLAGVPRVIHSDHARLFPDKLRYKLAEWAVSHLADKVVGVSDHTSDELHRHVRIPRHKLTTIPNGIVGERFRSRVDAVAKRRELGIRDGRPVLGIAARLESQKAHGDLLDAVALVRARLPDVLLLICGEGALEAELRERTRLLGLEENVRFLGVRQDMPELLQVFDVYVFPSLWEGLPMALLEAMAAGCPVVASAVGGVPTAILDGVNGITLPPRDPARLADAITRLLEDPALRRAYARRGQELFDQKFSATRMTRTYEELYVGD